MHGGETAASLALRGTPDGVGGSGNLGLVGYTRTEVDDTKTAMVQVEGGGLAVLREPWVNTAPVRTWRQGMA